MEDGRTRVAVQSPQEIVALGLVSMLSRHPDRVEVVRLGDEVDPDVVLYDVAGLVDGDGSDLVRLVADTSSAVLAVSRDARADLAARATDLGADGFVALAVDDRELLVAVESASTGWTDASEPEADGTTEPGGDVGLTEREREVLALIVRGLTNQDIADACFLSINSVKTYIRSAYRRIGVTTRSQAVVWALQHGFEARPDA